MKKTKVALLLIVLSTMVSCASHRKVIHSDNWTTATREVVKQYTPTANQHLRPYFKKAGIHYPPRRLALLAFKKEHKMELWAKQNTKWHLIRNYPILGKSGGPGPKLQQNDEQIPEGIYKISFLNPFSTLHLSMKINYPNEFDRFEAKQDGRDHLGGDIYIHGKRQSVGCLAIGDRAIEDLFVLVAKVGTKNTEVIISPNDLRVAPPIKLSHTQIPWIPLLDAKLARKLQQFVVS